MVAVEEARRSSQGHLHFFLVAAAALFNGDERNVSASHKYMDDL